MIFISFLDKFELLSSVHRILQIQFKEENMGNQFCQGKNFKIKGSQISSLVFSHHSSLPDSYNIEECPSPLPFSVKHNNFLRKQKNRIKTQESFVQIYQNEENIMLKVPETMSPKLLSSLQNSKKFHQTFINEWKSIINQVTVNGNNTAIDKSNKTATLTDLLNAYTNIIQKQNINKREYHKVSLDQFYQIKTQPIAQYYEILDKIGEGSYGSVYLGICKKTNQKKAIKILKKKFMNLQSEQKLLVEINLLGKLDHINIIKLFDIFYNKCQYYVVTEFCQGGTLLNALADSKIKTQQEIAIIIRQVLSAVSYLHENKIAHLDLKLDNIVLVKNITSQNIHQCVKLIDFGLAREAKQCFNNPCTRVGTLNYISPQVLSNKFSCHSDVWSCGIILCIMLTGTNPFRTKKKEQTIRLVLNKQFSTAGQEWEKISDEAKNLVTDMLIKKAVKRIPISRAIGHKWFGTHDRIQQIHGNNFMQKISKYYRGNNFEAFIKNYLISKRITQTEREQMAILFSQIDKNHSGFLEDNEIAQLYCAVKGVQITKQLMSQVKTSMNKIDDNKSGRIDFQQFLLVMARVQTIKNAEYLNQAFQFFDTDSTGYIQKQQLMSWLENEEQVQEIIKEIDFNGDGRVSREQFMQYIKNYCF